MLQRLKGILKRIFWALTKRNVIMVEYTVSREADGTDALYVQTMTDTKYYKEANIFVLEKAIEQINTQSKLNRPKK